MPTTKKREPVPTVGDDVRLYVDDTMIDEPARIIRIERDHIIVHAWPDSDARVAFRAQWFPTEAEATAYGVRGAWSE